MAKCADCGYLTLWHVQRKQMLCVPPSIRQSGKIPASSDGIYEYYTLNQCACHVEAHDVARGLGQADNIEKAFLEAINKPRDCDERGTFVQFVEGYTPEQHREIKLKMFTQSLDEWKKQQEAIAETRHQELRRDADRRHRQAMAVTVGGAIIAVLFSGVLAALLSWWLSN